MKLKELNPLTKDVIVSILQKPSSHTNNIPCPWLEASKEIKEMIQKIESSPSDLLASQNIHPALIELTANKVKRELEGLLEYTSSIYDDGRNCPISQLQWVLGKLFDEDRNQTRHPWSSVANVIRDGVMMGFIILEDLDYQLLSQQKG